MAAIPQQPRSISTTKKQWQVTVLIIFLGVVILHPFVAFHFYDDHTAHETQNLIIFEPPTLATKSNRNHSSSARPDVHSGAIEVSATTKYLVETQRLASVDDVETETANTISIPGCLTPACIDYQAARMAHAFPDRTDQAWCIRPSSNNETKRYGNNWSKDADGLWRGILLVKVPKGASSTSAGVAIRISRRHDCKAVEWMHRMATEFSPEQRSRSSSGSSPEQTEPSPSYLFTTIRKPSARAISTIFFHVVSRTNHTPTDEFITTYLKLSHHPHNGAVSEGQGGFQLRYTSLTEIPEHSAWMIGDGTNDNIKTRVQNPLQVMANVRNTLDNYDFIIVTERMDESLVAMALSMGLDVGDVLVTSSKVAGSRYHFAKYPHRVVKCLPTVKSFVSPKVQEFLDSDEWRAMNYGDFLLHQAANLSLDVTIDRLGRDRFDRALTKYRRLRALETVECAPHVKFPCSNEGQAQPKLSKRSCYLPYYDFGCGYNCIDEIVDAYHAEEES
jgi:hypothetical protein